MLSHALNIVRASCKLFMVNAVLVEDSDRHDEKGFLLQRYEDNIKVCENHSFFNETRNCFKSKSLLQQEKKEDSSMVIFACYSLNYTFGR